MSVIIVSVGGTEIDELANLTAVWVGAVAVVVVIHSFTALNGPNDDGGVNEEEEEVWKLHCSGDLERWGNQSGLRDGEREREREMGTFWSRRRDGSGRTTGAHEGTNR